MNKKRNRDVLRPREIASFCASMAMIIKSGIPINEGLAIMCEDAANTAGRDILEEILRHVETGGALHTALASTGNFPDYVVNMVEIGETTGSLDRVMESMTAFYEREEEVRRIVRNAVTYPLVMIAMMLAVIIILVVRVMPIFNEVFQGLGAQMTGFSLAVMNFGQALSRYSLVIVIIAAAVALVLWIFFSTKAGRRALERFRARFFLTRRLYAKISSGRFASAMALMLSSGMDTDQSLEMVHKLLKNQSARDKVAKCQKLLAEGMSFSDALSKVGMFTGVYARMVNVAYKTGSLDAIMEKLAERYEEETSTQIGNIISILEPSLVAVLSVIVGMILLSVMLPLMGIMATIG